MVPQASSMKYATFEHGGRERVGLVDTAAGRIHPLDVDGMMAPSQDK